jgi:tetratricopeptide (TPR) repeat protein
MQQDPSLTKLDKLHKSISAAVRNNCHPSTAEISEYILFKNGLSDNETGIIQLALKIEEHLRTCKKCEEEFKELNNEYAESEIFLNNSFAEHADTGAKNKFFLARTMSRASAFKFTLSAAVSILLICIFTMIISNITKPAYFDLAQLSKKPELSITRGRATDDFQRGIEAYDEGNYTQAIQFFKKDIKLNENENTIFYTYYIMGLTNLESAQNSILGLFPSFDKTKLSNSITALETCIQKNNSGEFPDINMNANYYLAKANLFLGNKQEAIINLKKVIDGKGSKMDEATEMLNKLE